MKFIPSRRGCFTDVKPLTGFLLYVFKWDHVYFLARQSTQLDTLFVKDTYVEQFVL